MGCRATGGDTMLISYLSLGAVLFVLGLIGFVTRRNLIIMFLCTELMFQGVAINLIAFGRFRFVTDPQVFFASQAFVIFILVVAAAGPARGVAIPSLPAPKVLSCATPARVSACPADRA